MSLRDEWREFQAIARQLLPERYHRLMEHRLFPCFIIGYPILFSFFLFLAFHFTSAQ